MNDFGEKLSIDLISIYFIEVHDENKIFQLSLSNNSETKNSEIELLKEHKFTYKNKLNYTAKVYRFNISNIKNEFEISVIFKEEPDNKNEYKREITNKDMGECKRSHIFLYDFTPLDKNQNNFFVLNSNDYPLNHEEQFQIYLNSLKEKNILKENSKENIDLIQSTSYLFKDKNAKYDFKFFMLVFFQSFNTELIKEHLLSFQTHKLISLGEFNDKELQSYIEIINKITENPDIILKSLTDESKNKASSNLYTIILYFNLKFQKEKLISIFKYNHQLFYSIFLYNSSLFQVLDLNEIKKILSLPNDYFIVLHIIDISLKYILKAFNEEIKKIDEKKRKKEKTKLFIQIEEYAEPKEEDNINTINSFIKHIIEFQKNNTQFISFSPSFFEKLIESNENNLENLLIIKETLEVVKNYENSSKYKHINHSIEKSVKNMDEKYAKNWDSYDLENIYIKIHFKDNENFNEYYALKGIKNNEINQEFINEWKEKNFKNKEHEKFIEIACSKVDDLNQFNILLKLLLEGKEGDSYKRKALICIQNKFFNLYKNYSTEDLMEYLDIISNIINKSDEIFRDDNVETFLKKIENILSEDFIVSLYIHLLNNYQELSNKVKKLIYNYLKSISIENIVKLFKDLNNEDFSYLIDDLLKYIIEKNYFFLLEDTPSIKLLKLLINEDIFKKENLSNIFIKKTYEKLVTVKNMFIDKNYTYSDIKIFFQEEENKDKLFDKIDLLCLPQGETEEDYEKEKEKIKNIKKNIEFEYDKLNKYIETFNIIIKYLSYFYQNLYKEEIEDIVQLHFNMSFSKIKDLKDDKIKYYIDKFGKIAKERERILENKIFQYIYNLEKSKNSHDEKKIVNESFKKFNELKIIFEEDNFNEIKEEILDIYINVFNNNNEEEIKKEIKQLAIILYDVKEYEECDNKIDDIVKKLILLSKKGELITVTKAIKMFIEQSESIQEEYYEALDNILELSTNSYQIDFMKMCIDLLKDLDIDIMDERQYFINIFKILYQKPEVIKFLLSTKVEECGLLYDSLDSNNFIKISDILELEKCVEYMNNIQTINEEKKLTDYELIQKAKFFSYNYKELELYFNNFINHYDDIKETIQQKFDKSETSRRKIMNICKKSNLMLSTIEKNFFEGKYIVIDEEKNTKTTKKINLSELHELRDTAVLSLNIMGESNDNKIFVDIVSDILKVNNLLEEIYISGYSKYINIEIKILDNNYFFSFLSPESLVKINSQQIPVEKVLKDLKTILKDLKTNYKEGYKKKKFIRYVYGRQFNNLYNYSKYNLGDITPFLQFITNNELKKNINKEMKWIEEENEFQEVINNCNNYIERIIKNNNLSLEIIYEKTIIKNNGKFRNQEYKGLYVYSCSQVEKELIQLYIYLTGNIPIFQNILLCNKDTSNEEITSFLYRSLLCEFNSCFIIGGIELLNFNQKNYFLELLNEILSDKKEKINSCLIILSNDKNTDIYRRLYSIKCKKTFNSEIETLLKNIKIDICNNVTIVSSDRSGLGKSTKIKNYILKNKKTYVHFPIGGVFTREDIYIRLKELNLKENSAIHLDLYDTDYTDLLSEFLFFLLINKVYKVKEDIFCLLKDTEIYVEIPNGFIDFYAKFPILTLLPQKEQNKLSIDKLEPLIVSNEISSNIQIVCNYLTILDKIEEKDLIIPGITPNYNNNISNKNNKFNLAKNLYQNECQEIIFNQFKNKEIYSYYQVKTFIDVLAFQFKKFNQSFIFKDDYLIKNEYLKNIRTIAANSFIKFSNYSTEGAFTELIKEKRSSRNVLFGQYDQNEDIKVANDKLAKNEHFIVSFDKIDSPLIIFHQGNQVNFSTITNKGSDDEEYKPFVLLKQFQKTKDEDIKTFKDYKDQIDFLKEIKDILGINNHISKKDIQIIKDLKSLEEIADNYAFTQDNFVKMVLILIRIGANIPIIMMGETGCGKTSLIKKLYELKNNGKELKILNIHAGTTNKDVIDFMEKINIEAEKLKSIEEKKLKTKKKLNMLYEEEKFLVFLDEINTCKSMGLISELICNHTCQGKPICSNIVFISACNPYRKIEKPIEKMNGIDINLAYKDMDNLNEKEKMEIIKSRGNQLVYKVNPLPHSLLNYVFDFGNVSEKDEEKYINIMIKPTIEKNFKNQEEIKIEEIKDLAKKMIIESQNFLREFNDVSSVSLREIRRYTIFYDFFYTYLKNKKEKYLHLIENKMKEINFEYDKLTEFDLQIYSINLAIFICYYLRIQDKEKRKELVERLNKIFTYRDFLELPLLEEHFIADNIELPKGTAKNKALLENLFSLFCSINVKIPIFIVGKPGCSKSLSVQLIYKSMKGPISKNELFKDLPKLVLFPYQGSLGSTSEGVEQIFKRAQNGLKRFKEENKNCISMIFFDEMGLAENSPNNPLKVIHSELEYDSKKDDEKIAFVGISNWVLDASKMNRGLHISIPELDEEDAINTALTIAKSYNEDLPDKFNEFFKNLGKTYYKYKQYLKRKHCNDGREDFHGNRDFYHFVKNVSKNILPGNINTINENELISIGLRSIERNFAGFVFNNKTSVEVVKKFFLEFYPNYENNQKYNSIENIRNNKKDDNSRYLLLISKSIETCYLLTSILEDSYYNIIIGSQFKEDIKSEEYQLKMIRKIQIFMEKGKTIILKDIESIYPALYDLFNQNFISMSGKNYARISIGSTFTTYSNVHKNFKCIVDVNIDKINK